MTNTVWTPEKGWHDGDPPRLGHLLDTCRTVTATKSYHRGPPYLIDLFTASAVVAAFDRLSPENQTKALRMTFVRFANFAMSRVKP